MPEKISKTTIYFSNGLTRQINPLTGIRGIAALWVFGYHLRQDITTFFPGSVAERLMNGLCNHGYLGVDLFFVLSGFVIGLHYMEPMRSPTPQKVLQFLRKRLARIYPVHLFMLLFMFALVLAAGLSMEQPRFSVANLFFNVVLLHGWGFVTDLTWNEPSWSISAEWFAYLSFPFLARPVLSICSRRGIALSVVASYGVMIALLVLFNDGQILGMRFNLVRVAGSFVAGCLLVRAFALGFGSRARWWPVAAVAVAWMLSALWLDWPLIAVVAMPPIIYSLAWDQSIIARFLGSGPMRYAGRISYAFYMVQAPVIIVMRAFLRREVVEPWGTGGKIAVLLALFGMTLLVAHLTYRAVEEPARRRIGKINLRF